MVVIAPPPSLSPPSEQAMTESSRSAPLHVPTTLQNTITQSTIAASTSATIRTSGNTASTSHYNINYSTAQAHYNNNVHTHAPYTNARKTRPYCQYTNGIPAHRNNHQIYPTLTPPTNGNAGLLTIANHHPHNRNHNNGHLYHNCTFPCAATGVLTGGDAALPTRFSFGPGFEPQQLFGVGQYGARTGATPRVPPRQQQQSAVAGNHQEHIVLFHVNPGVTIRFQIGENLEVLRGPVTVPMVSTNSTPPIAMPIQVPVGHMVQQIVDERGTLRHVILSPTHPANLVPMPHQHYTDGTTGTNGLTTSTSTTTSPGGAHHPSAAGGQPPQPPPPGSVGGYPHHHHHHHHYGPTPPTNPNQSNSGGGGGGGGLSPSSGYRPPHAPHHHSPHYHTNMPPPPPGGGGVGTMGSEPSGQFYNKDERTQRQYNKLRKKLIDKRKEQAETNPGGSGVGGSGGGGGGTNSSSSSTSSSSGVGVSQSQQAVNQRLRQTGSMVMLVKEKVGGMNSVGTSEDGEESSSVQEDDDTILADMLSSVQAPTVSELSSRCALLQWAIPPAIVDHNTTLASLASNASTSSGLSTAGSSTASSLSPATSVVVTSATAASPVTTVGSASSTVDLPEINEARLRYEVLLSDGDKARRFKSIYSGRSLSCRIQDLRPGQEYTVCLQVHLEELRGTATDPIRFTTPACEPDQPLPPQLNSRKKNSVQLRWSAPDSDNGSHIIHYILEVTPSPNPTTPTTPPASTDPLPSSPSSNPSEFTEAYRGKSRSYTLQKLTPSTPYRFRLCAVNGLGPSQWSDVVCFRTLEPAPSAPSTPILVEANVYSLSLRWERREGVDGVFTLEMESEIVRYMPVYNGDGAEFHLRDLTACTDYKFRLAASNEGGCSPWSEEARYSTRPAAPHAPAKPTARGRIGAHSFRLGWEAPQKTGGAPITEYTVELNSGSGFETIYCGAATDMACTALTPGTTYQARVSCSSRGGRSPLSDPCTVTTDAVAPNACPPPALKGGANAKPTTDRYVILTLEGPDYNGGAPVLEYEVEMGSCGEESKGTDVSQRKNVYKGRDLECLVANLLPGTTYSFTSRAINRIGGGAWSVPFSVMTTAAVPDAPSQLTGVCRTAHSAQLEWCTPEANGAPITDYRLEYSTQPDFTLPEATTVTTVPTTGYSTVMGSCATHEIRGLTPFTTYYLRISATNVSGSSSPSPTVTMSTPASTPAIPTHLRCESSPMTLLITWSPPACHGSPITHYNVDVADVTYATATAEPELLVEELAPETAYKVRVQACNSVGCGGYSGVLKTATLKMPPEAPRIECVGTAWNSLKLKWGEGKNQDYTTYQLELLNPFTRDYQCVCRGSAYTWKVNKLNEQTCYRFRICAENDAGRGLWSVKDWEFETAVAPPAAVRIPRPVDLDVDQRVCTLEWTASKGQGADTIVYILQVAVVGGAGQIGGTRRKGGDKEVKMDQLEFREVYRGPDTRHIITHLDLHADYHARVCPVRMCANGKPLTGTHSPVLTFHAPSPLPVAGCADSIAFSAASTTSAVLTRTGANAAAQGSARGSGGSKNGAGLQKQPLVRRIRELTRTFAENYKAALLSFLVVFLSVVLTTIMYIISNDK